MESLIYSANSRHMDPPWEWSLDLRTFGKAPTPGKMRIVDYIFCLQRHSGSSQWQKLDYNHTGVHYKNNGKRVPTIYTLNPIFIIRKTNPLENSHILLPIPMQRQKTASECQKLLWIFKFKLLSVTKFEMHRQDTDLENTFFDGFASLRKTGPQCSWGQIQ